MELTTIGKNSPAKLLGLTLARINTMLPWFTPQHAYGPQEMYRNIPSIFGQPVPVGFLLVIPAR